MAFNQGDLITAIGINEINKDFCKTYAESHVGWKWKTFIYYFYCTKDLDEKNMVNYSAVESTGKENEIIILRYENGEWTEKFNKKGQGELHGGYKSYGNGMYQFKLGCHNYTPTTKIYPCKPNCVTGDYLKMLSAGPIFNNLAELESVDSRCHNYIKATDLNEGRVYT